jgi:hypothetical protein
MKPLKVWLLKTDVKNSGTTEEVYLTREVALENAVSIILDWCDTYNPLPTMRHQKQWDITDQSIRDAIDAGDKGDISQYEAAIELWNSSDNDAEISVCEKQVKNC